MNIKQAKETIKNTVQLYLKKDEFLEYRIPVIRQRPIFLLGAPGIGKTAVMEQVASELGIALVSYSMTHHTRQSALGLPIIKQKEYHGETYDVSEYTMSEIIASIYEVMEESGIKEGILFLDEINCVSETLSPSMLQFLQYKIFGKHKVPEGWVIVTAGNPPEYNKSVREFDVVTLDRLKILQVEADYNTWKEYALEMGIHNAIVSFLDLKKEYFYHMETTVRGRAYVTARGWEDLSQILFLYEEEKLLVDETLIEQYIRNERVVKEFAAYYDLYQKYKNDYQIEEILAGHILEETIEKARVAAFDERLSLMGMLLDKVLGAMKENIETSDYLKDTMVVLRAAGSLLEKEEKADQDSLIDILEKQIEAKEKLLNSLAKANSLSKAEKRKNKRIIQFLSTVKKNLYVSQIPSGQLAYEQIKEKFNQEVMTMKSETESVKAMLHQMFLFVEKAFGEANEMLILVTELTVNTYSARFIGLFGSEDYIKYNKQMMISERQMDLKKEIAALEL
ncbi:MAG: AAA family ATPase [Lachnospiraceae bacterium]|nr:AAA family ATPase [Lachnospiraceae bacterium]